MGNKKNPPVIAECKSPVYCVKKIGCRHILLAGGGGAAKTGVANNIEAHLLTFDQNVVTSPAGMRAQLVHQVDTAPFATMNMDVCRTAIHTEGKFLIAAGHDQFCHIYESNGFSTVSADGPGEAGSLTFKFNEVATLTTDTKADGGYQKCVRFDSSSSGARLVTGGADGCLRLWDMKKIAETRPKSGATPLLVIDAHKGDVDDIDISPDGTMIVSVGYDGQVHFWDMATGKNVLDLPVIPQFEKQFKVRSVRFTALGERNVVFVAAYNQIQRNSKSKCYLTLWSYNRERAVCKPIAIEEVGKGESISTLCVSSCGHFTGIGTLGGSVGIYDTHEMKQLKWNKETHGIFVTGVEFLDRTATDLHLPMPNGPSGVPLLPGPAASGRASLVSLSADQTVQLHVLPFETSPSTTLFLLKLSIILLLVNLVFFFLLGG